MIGRAARTLVRNKLVATTLANGVARLRRRELLGEDIVPYGIHRFDRHAWVIKESSLGFRLWCSLDDRAISRPILLDTYEVAETRFMASAVRKGDVVIDAGANIGFHTMHLAAIAGDGGRVIAFEPLPYLADALEASVAENRFAARVAVHRAALDEIAGEATLRHAPRTANFGGAHLAPHSPLPEAHTDERIATQRLDDVIGEGSCAFIKMDVEGAEPRVVRGARATLAANRPIILAELHDEQLRAVSKSSASEFIAMMASLGYGCARLNSDGTRGHALERYDAPAPINVVFDPLTGNLRPAPAVS